MGDTVALKPILYSLVRIQGDSIIRLDLNQEYIIPGGSTEVGIGGQGLRGPRGARGGGARGGALSRGPKGQGQAGDGRRCDWRCVLFRRHGAAQECRGQRRRRVGAAAGRRRPGGGGIRSGRLCKPPIPLTSAAACISAAIQWAWKNTLGIHSQTRTP